MSRNFQHHVSGQQNVVAYNVANMTNRIKEIRKKQGLSLQVLADRIGTSNQMIQYLESGKRKLSVDWANKIATGLRVDIMDILGEKKEPSIPLVGYVGSGTEIFPYSNDLMNSDTFELLEVPIISRAAIPAKEIMAVKVKGDSMMPVIQDNWIIYYHAQNSIEKCLRKLCIVKLKNGSCYVKELRKGSKQNHYMLLFYNAAPIEDAQIEWAYPIISIELI